MSEFVNTLPYKELCADKPVVVLTSNWGGLGHTMRDIGIMQRLVKRGVPTLSCSQRGVEPYIRASFPDEDPAKFGAIDLKDTTKPTEYNSGTFLESNPYARHPLRNAGVVLADFMPAIKKILREEDRDDTLATGTYHSLDPIPRSPNEADWQTRMLAMADPLDVLFHMTIIDSPVSDHGPLIVPVNPIAREVTKSPDAVKEELGLSQDEEFVLIAGGMGGHPSLTKFLQEVKPPTDGIRYVVQIGTNATPPDDFPPHLIWANAKVDGQNYINAATAVVTKPGYGTIAECLATRTPVLLPPHEHPEGSINRRLMSTLLEGLPVEFNPIRDPDSQIKDLLSAQDAISARMEKVPCDGAEVIADFLITARERTLNA